MNERLQRARDLCAFAPVIALPLGLVAFGALYVKLDGVRVQNAQLRNDIAALHTQVVDVRKRVDHIDLKVKPSTGTHLGRPTGDRSAPKKSSAASGERKKRTEGATGTKKRTDTRGAGDGARAGGPGQSSSRPSLAKVQGGPKKARKGGGGKRQR